MNNLPFTLLLLLCVLRNKSHGGKTITCDTNNPVDSAVELTQGESGYIVPLIQPPSYASDHAKCDITLVAAATSLITIDFTHFAETECKPTTFDYFITGDFCDSSNHCDYLLIHEPYETSIPLKKYDGYHTGDVYTSHSHKVHIRFCFNKPYKDTASRWKLTFQVEEREGIQLFEGSAKTSGVVRTPFFPFGYSLSKDYQWLFVNTEIQGYVFIQFDDMLLAPGHTLEIFDGGGPWANRERRTLSDRRPFFSTGPLVYASMKLQNVQGTRVGAGFKLTYNLIQYKRFMSRYKTRTDTLANNSHILPGLVPRSHSGLVNLQMNEHRSLYYDYLWIIPPLKLPEAAVVHIINYSFPVGSELQVRHGYHSDANLIFTFIGSFTSSKAESKVIISDKGLYLRLTGFFFGIVYLNMSYAIFRDLKQDPNYVDKSQGCKFPDDVNNSLPAMGGFVCQHSLWCIPEFLVCDGVAHCAKEEDEAKDMCGMFTTDLTNTASTNRCQDDAFSCVTTQNPCDGLWSTCATTTTEKAKTGHHFMTWVFIAAPILLVLCISFCMVWLIRKSRNRHRVNSNPPDYQEYLSSTISHTVSFTRTLQSGHVVNSRSHSDLLIPSHGDMGPFGIVNPAMQRSESMDSILNMPAPPSYNEVIAGNEHTFLRAVPQPPPPTYEESQERETIRRQSLPCPPPYSSSSSSPRRRRDENVGTDVSNTAPTADGTGVDAAAATEAGGNTGDGGASVNAQPAQSPESVLNIATSTAQTNGTDANCPTTSGGEVSPVVSDEGMSAEPHSSLPSVSAPTAQTETDVVSSNDTGCDECGAVPVTGSDGVSESNMGVVAEDIPASGNVTPLVDRSQTAPTDIASVSEAYNSDEAVSSTANANEGGANLSRDENPDDGSLNANVNNISKGYESQVQEESNMTNDDVPLQGTADLGPTDEESVNSDTEQIIQTSSSQTLDSENKDSAQRDVLNAQTSAELVIEADCTISEDTGGYNDQDVESSGIKKEGHLVLSSEIDQNDSLEDDAECDIPRKVVEREDSDVAVSD